VIVQEGFFTEQEQLVQQLADKQEIINRALEIGIISEEFFKAISLKNAKVFQDKLKKIETKGLTDRQKFEMKTTQAKTEFVLSEIVRMTQGVATHNKALFKINKIAAIASAVIALPEHVSRTMSKYPYPLSIAMGALAAAASLAQIQAIRSQSFGGGGVGTTPSAAGTVPVINDIPVSELGTGELLGGIQAPESTVVTVNVVGLEEGTLLDSNTVRTILESINEALGDGVEIRT